MKHNSLPLPLKLRLEQRALSAYHLALNRVGLACPKWVRGRWKYKKLLMRVYFKAQVKNHFRSAYGKSGDFYHVDHILPLKYKVKGKLVACGLHVPWNLHVIPAPINLAKGTMLVPEWMEGKDSIATLEKAQEKRKARQEDLDRRRGDRRRRQARKRAMIYG